MKIQWEVTSLGSVLKIEGNEMGYFTKPNSRNPTRALFQIGTHTYTLERRGFWKTGITIHDENGNEIIHGKLRNWWSNSMVFTYLDETYSISIYNDPTVTWKISKVGKSVLEYSIAVTSKGNGIKIKQHEEVPVVFHGILWYGIHAVLQEQTGLDEGAVIVVLV